MLDVFIQILNIHNIRQDYMGFLAYQSRHRLDILDNRLDYQSSLAAAPHLARLEIGRASCRERV